MRRSSIAFWLVVALAGLFCATDGRAQQGGAGGGAAGSVPPAEAAAGGSVIFIHVDGTGMQTWTAARLLGPGPDGELEWDKLPRLGLYRGHMADALVPPSHGAATVAAWGVKVPSNSFGKAGKQSLTAANGGAVGLGRQAIAAGKAVAIVSSASVVDAGTGCFLASVDSRRDGAGIAEQMLAAGPAVLLGGGEVFFLPKGVTGRHGKEGVRADGRNLIDEAKKAGYEVVFTAAELEKVMASGGGQAPTKLLGLFAAEATFNDKPEEVLAKEGTPLFVETAPPIDRMLAAALAVVGGRPGGFFIVAEEEATDNFGGENNAAGVIEALTRADRAIGLARQAVASTAGVTLLVGSDSDCGGLGVMAVETAEAEKPLPAQTPNGSPIDGVGGTGGKPFVAAADARGVRMPFAIAWGSETDMSGAVLWRAEGTAAEWLPTKLDNTRVYAFMHRALFGVEVPAGAMPPAVGGSKVGGSK